MKKRDPGRISYPSLYNALITPKLRGLCLRETLTNILSFCDLGIWELLFSVDLTQSLMQLDSRFGHGYHHSKA